MASVAFAAWGTKSTECKNECEMRSGWSSSVVCATFGKASVLCVSLGIVGGPETQYRYRRSVTLTSTSLCSSCDRFCALCHVSASCRRCYLQRNQTTGCLQNSLKLCGCSPFGMNADKLREALGLRPLAKPGMCASWRASVLVGMGTLWGFGSLELVEKEDQFLVVFLCCEPFFEPHVE